MKQEETKSVFVAIIGRPNVGKSSLLNRLVGEKAAIVTPKPQTTRTRITGILTRGPVQYVFIDTPGLHNPKTKLGKRMERTAEESAGDGDVVLMLFDPEEPLAEIENSMVSSLKDGAAIAVINKADTIRLGEVLAKRKIELEALGVFDQVLVTSAATGEGCEELLSAISAHAVESPHFFAEDQYTDQPEKQLVAEVIREQLLLNMQQEIPHGTMVEVESYKEAEQPTQDGRPFIQIDATIYCEKKSHKGMIIGKGGQMLKKIATGARLECEEMLGAKIHLQCWVKVREGWRDNEAMLRRMGFGEGN